MIDVSTALYTTLGFSVASAAAGYYIGDKGWSAVEADLSALKLDIANIKGKIDGSTVAVTRVTPTGTVTHTVPVATGSVGTAGGDVNSTPTA